jgi:uncharacterized iron-regulated membrane protein
MTALFLFGVRVDPVNSFSWGGLIVLLLIVFALAVSFVAGLVFFLLWWKRRSIRDQEYLRFCQQLVRSAANWRAV